MELGKPAGIRCVQLSGDDRCLLFGDARRPAVCARLAPSAEMCGDSREEALRRLAAWEEVTKPKGV